MLLRLLASIEITRPHNMLASALSVVVGYHVADGGDLTGVWVPAALAAVITGAGNIINDHYDVVIDRINKPRRPLPSGRLTVRHALTIYVLLTLATNVALFALVPRLVAVLMLGWQVALVGYAVWLKRVLIAGNLLVATVTSSAFLAGALIAGRPTGAMIPVMIAFVFVLSRELVKGAEDVTGDAPAGVHTVASRFGVARAAWIAAIIMTLLAVLIPVPAFIGYFGPGYLWTMMLSVVPGLLAGAWMIVHRPDTRTFCRVSWILKFGMFFGIFAIALG